jgi:ribosomal protein S18 acetylase RimI-like enzyme
MTIADDPRERALAWIRHEPEALCDRIEARPHGTVYRATRYPRYSNLNMVRVADDPGLDAAALAAFVERSLAGLDAYRMEFDDAAEAEPLRRDMEALGFLSMRLTWLRFEGPRPEPAEGVTEVPYDEVEPLRAAWQGEDYPGVDPTEYLAQSREVRLSLGMRTLAMYDGSRPVAFAGLEPGHDEFEIAALYVAPEYRGEGRGTALTLAAIASGGPARDVWICADDEDRPKDLYQRLGFAPVLTTARFMRLPGLRLDG